MAKQTINIGTTANDGTGDTIRDGGDKINDNFTEIYGVSGIIKSNGSTTVSAAVAGTDYYAPGSTDVAVADGGTGASTASGARTNLGLVIGTDVQAYDADLATIAGLTATTDNFIQAKSSAWASRTPTQVTADLINFVGDSGAGGSKGLVPAPSAGDAAASKFLKADGTWAAPSGSGDFSSNTATSVDSEIVLFSGTGGKTGKRATTTGILKGTSGVLSAAVAGTDYYNPGGTDVAVADGGTGASTASGARTNLGLVIGTDVQAYDAELTALAGLTSANNKVPYFTGSGTASTIDKTSAATASTLVERDSNANTFINNAVQGYTTTATAAGTTTLTVASTYMQFFTGTTTQTVQLPVTSTLTTGHQFYIRNNSTGAVTITSSGGNTVRILAAGTRCMVTCISTSGTTAASWSANYLGAIGTDGKSLSYSNTLTLAGTDGTTMTFPSGSGSVLTADSTATVTNKSIAGSQLTGAYTAAGMTMATARLLGRSTASTGAVEEITVGSGLSLSAGTLSASGGGSSNTGTIFSTVADATVGNTTTETTLVNTTGAAGSLSITGNTLAAGDVYHFKGFGYSSNTGGSWLNIRIKFGSTTICYIVSTTIQTTSTTQLFEIDAWVTCRTTGASGTMVGGGSNIRYNGAKGADLYAIHAATVSSPSVTVDTTATASWDITAQHQTANASNTVTLYNLVVTKHKV